ncbi:hypothetical protein MPSEU_000400600 [Mayamaea pseudoterrestris]|nr:hypothetical protein MPSEU_000400600 [Mayamaea pseudoterrestris]
MSSSACKTRARKIRDDEFLAALAAANDSDKKPAAAAAFGDSPQQNIAALGLSSRAKRARRNLDGDKKLLAFLASGDADKKPSAVSVLDLTSSDLMDDSKMPAAAAWAVSNDENDDDEIVYLGTSNLKAFGNAQRATRSSSLMQRRKTRASAPFQSCDADLKLALEMQDDELDSMQADADRLFAESLLKDLYNESKEQEEKAMMSTEQGRAVKFNIATVAIDDLVYLAERLIVKQNEFKATNVCSNICIGFHYTKPENMKHIRTNGLLTRMERSDKKIKAKFNGSAYGVGVYTASNPIAYRGAKQYGPICLIVARLKGEVSKDIFSPTLTYENGPLVVLRSSHQCLPLIQFTITPGNLTEQYHVRLQALIDSIFNGGQATPIQSALAAHMAASGGPMGAAFMGAATAKPTAPVTAAGGGQAAPIQPALTAHMAARGGSWGAAFMGAATVKLTATVTAAVSAALATAPNMTSGAQLPQQAPLAPGSSNVGLNLVPPVTSVASAAGNKTITYVAPSVFGQAARKNILTVRVSPVLPSGNCVICLNTLGHSKLGRLRLCGHDFHYDCITTGVLHLSRCPMCNIKIGDEPQGMMPSGTMSISTRPSMTCGGWTPGTIEIHYRISGGTQMAYHANPGIPFAGISRTALKADFFSRDLSTRSRTG